jgi:purine-binding chemotaxis protein CheW
MADHSIIGSTAVQQRQTTETTRLDKLQRRLVQCRKALEKGSVPDSIDARRTLKIRADTLARKRDGCSLHDAMEVVVFQLAHERYALDLRYVGEVKELNELTPLPCTPSFIAGIVNLRGRIVSIVDLMQFLGLTTTAATGARYVIILYNADMEFGILTDEITGVSALPANTVQAVPKGFGGSGNAFLKGITSDRIALLDAKQLLSDPNMIVNKQERSVTQQQIA